jgi:hypothetical protein
LAGLTLKFRDMRNLESHRDLPPRSLELAAVVIAVGEFLSVVCSVRRW